jgi:hypothetical protein
VFVLETRNGDKSTRNEKRMREKRIRDLPPGLETVLVSCLWSIGQRGNRRDTPPIRVLYVDSLCHLAWFCS